MKKVLKLVAIAALSVGSFGLNAMIPQGNNQGPQNQFMPFNQGQQGMPNVQQNQFMQPFNPMAYAQQQPMVPGMPMQIPQQPMVPGMPMQMPYQVTTTTTYYQPFVVYPSMRQTTITYFQPLFMSNQQPVAQPMLQQMLMAMPPVANNVVNNVAPAAVPPANNTPAVAPLPTNNVTDMPAVAPMGDEVTLATEMERTCNCPVEAVASSESANTGLLTVANGEDNSNTLAHNLSELLTTAEDSNILPPSAAPINNNEANNSSNGEETAQVDPEQIEIYTNAMNLINNGQYNLHPVLRPRVQNTELHRMSLLAAVNNRNLRPVQQNQPQLNRNAPTNNFAINNLIVYFNQLNNNK